MRKRILFFLPLVIPVFLFLGAGLLQGAEDKSTEETPEWLKRVDFGIDAGTDLESRIYFETVQPLYQDIVNERTDFIQLRYGLQDENSSCNLGLGSRKLLDNNSVLLGFNTFFDYEDEHKHYRMGFGGEAFINQIELRGNSYIGLSPQRLVKETPTGKEYEKAVDGFDAEIGLPLPHMNWIKIFGAGYWYNYQKFSNKEGWKIRGEFKPLSYTTINLIAWDDNIRRRSLY